MATETITPGHKTIVNGKWNIILAKDLPELARGPATCHPATNLEDPSTNYIAWISPRIPGPKIRQLNNLVYKPHAMLLPIDHGPIWIGEEQSYAIIFPKPSRVVPQRRYGKFAADYLLRYFLKPALEALYDLNRSNASHGHIYPDNVFFSDQNDTEIHLGPNTILPDGYCSDPVYQPIERALASPIGRGQTVLQDDIFSLGMTLYTLATGLNPESLDKPKIISHRRIAFGSASALVKMNKIPNGMHDIIEGMIDDDINLRWTIEDITAWMNGRHSRPAPPLVPKKILPPFKIGEFVVQSQNEMAYVIGQDHSVSAPFLRDGRIDRWLTGTTQIEEGALEFVTAKESSDITTVAQASIHYNPAFPVPMEGISFFPNAIGRVLRLSTIDDNIKASIADFIKHNMNYKWLMAANLFKGIDPQPLREFQKHERYIQNDLPTALYNLDPDAPCLSPLTKGQWITSISQIGDIVEENSQDDSFRPDPHLIGFLTAKIKIDPSYFAESDDIADKEDDAHASAAYIDTCANIQMATGLTTMPRFARTLIKRLSVVTKLFRRPSIGEEIYNKALAALEAGDIITAADVILSTKMHTDDERSYLEAKTAWDRAMTFLKASDHYRNEMTDQILNETADTSLMIAGLCSALTVLGTFYLATTKMIF